MTSFSQPIIRTVAGHYHQRFKYGRPSFVDCDLLPHVRWHRIRHESVGGGSLFVTIHGTINCANIEPQVTTIRRTLGDFLNHQTRPTYLVHLKACPQPPLIISDRVSPLYWNRPIAFQTHFFSSGWGIRPLTIDELCSIFSFPVRLRMGLVPMEVFDCCTPVQLLLAILHPVLIDLQDTLTLPNKRHCTMESKTFPVTVPPPKSDIMRDAELRSWLPSINRWLPHSWIDPSVITPGAAKRDDASIPTYMWDRRLQLLYPLCSLTHLECLRTFLLQKVRRNVVRSLCTYLRQTYTNDWAVLLKTTRATLQQGGTEPSSDSQLLIDVERGLDVLFRFDQCSWWDWCGGSSLIFWRWGPYVSSTLPTFRKRSRQPKPELLPLIATKFAAIIQRKYLMPGPIHSLTQFFDVPKGLGDIRLVYNGTSCGFNSALWCPKFWLPTAKTALRCLDYGYYSVDMDLGEMFLNFPLHQSLQAYSGVDLTPYKQALGNTSQGPYHLRWTRTWMGARPSPYCAVRFYYIADEFVRGNNLDPNNPFYWDTVRLNLPGSRDYNPSLPRVMKWNSIHNCIAADLIVYVDDLRVQGRDVETAWALAHTIATRLQYLGIQVAIRKTRPPTRTPGAWAGAIFRTSHDSVCCSVSQEKWDKAKGIVETLIQEMEDQNNLDNTLDYKRLEISRGFLVHLSMTFDVITHYLKGFHLALAAHNQQRNDEGWRLNDKDWLVYLQHKQERGEIAQAEIDLFIQRKEYKKKKVNVVENTLDAKQRYIYDPPPKAKIVEQLKKDLFALRSFFDSNLPPQIEVRKKKVSLLLYGFADASGGGLGSTVLIPGTGIRYRVGVWGADSEDNSSNYREFENVVMTIEEEARSGTLNGSIMFLFTDNTTVEGALFKGNTSNKKLFDLVVRVRKIELQHDATITVIHVAGKRMIAQGTDGISRGQLNEGVASGIPMLDYVPLHLSALDRHPPLRPWIKSWLGHKTEFLEPYDWFVRGHDIAGGYWDTNNFWANEIKTGHFVWSPPPAAAEVALEEMRKAVIKRQHSTHVFICPRLLTPEWRRQLLKVADIVFVVDVGCDIWPSNMFEPLTFGFVFPLLSVKPWQRQGTPKMRYMARILPKLLQTSDVAARNILRKFCVQGWKLCSLSEHVVRAVLYFEG